MQSITHLINRFNRNRSVEVTQHGFDFLAKCALREPEKITAGYRCYTGHVLTAVQADAINRANEKARLVPSEENKNGAHNLFQTIALTGKI